MKSFAVRALLIASLPLSALAPLRAAEPAEAKNFVLFMGADIDVQRGKDTFRVKNVVGDSFIIVVDQKPVEVPMNRGPIAMKVTPQLKLSDKGASVKDLKFARAYTPANDPNKKWAAAQAGSAAQAQLGNSAGQLGSAMMGQQLGGQRANALGGGMASINMGDNGVGDRLAAMNSASLGNGSDLNSAGYASQKLQEELDKQLFDAVLVTCEVSAPKQMRDPYLVIITNYKVKDEPNVTKSWVYAKALDRLDEAPLQVHILQGGFPPGFEMVKQQFHVYGAGRELGTNVADKNVALTRDEAHQYIVIDHITTHKGATVPPSVALGVGAKDFYPHYGSEQVKQEIYVKVDKDGLPHGAFRDEACAKPFGDEFLDGLVTRTLFKPALKAGKPVDGVAKLTILGLATPGAS